jgi:hypothetical protein
VKPEPTIVTSVVRTPLMGVNSTMPAAESSLTMVPVPEAAPIVALAAPERLSVNVSLGSTAVSPMTGTTTVWLATPGANVSVPEVLV